MAVQLFHEPFDPWQQIQLHQQWQASLHGKIGAADVFIGTMRDFNDGDDVVGMYLEHYPEMTERQLEQIAAEAHRRWSLLDTLLLHRTGNVFPGDTLVVTAAWSAHRGDAFDANRFIMEAIKSRATFWKKELLKTGQRRWVEKNTDGYTPRSVEKTD